MRNNADFEARQARSEGSYGSREDVHGVRADRAQQTHLPHGHRLSGVLHVPIALPFVTQLASNGSGDIVTVLLTTNEGLAAADCFECSRSGACKNH